MWSVIEYGICLTVPRDTPAAVLLACTLIQYNCFFGKLLSHGLPNPVTLWPTHFYSDGPNFRPEYCGSIETEPFSMV